MSDVFEHLDGVVDRLAALRDELLADEFAPDRAARLAAVFESEARAWSQVYELTHLRLIWRAALAAEAGARANAARSGPSTAATASRGFPNHGFSSGEAQSTVTSRPPGSSTRASSRGASAE